MKVVRYRQEYNIDNWWHSRFWVENPPNLGQTEVKSFWSKLFKHWHGLSSKVHIRTWNSTNVTIVQNLREHISLNCRHSKFWMEEAQKLSQSCFEQFYRALDIANFGSRSRENWAVFPMPTFTKVVAYYTISNFCFWRFWSVVQVLKATYGQTWLLPRTLGVPAPWSAPAHAGAADLGAGFSRRPYAAATPGPAWRRQPCHVPWPKPPRPRESGGRHRFLATRRVQRGKPRAVAPPCATAPKGIVPGQASWPPGVKHSWWKLVAACRL